MANLEWDQELPLELREQWHHIVSSFPALNQLQIPRWSGILNRELHVFSDASERTYSAAVYLRGIDSSGQLKACLLVAKNRVAPIKPLSIPRLELCGALLGVQLIKSQQITFLKKRYKKSAKFT